MTSMAFVCFIFYPRRAHSLALRKVGFTNIPGGSAAQLVGGSGLLTSNLRALSGNDRIYKGCKKGRQDQKTESQEALAYAPFDV